MPARMTCHYQRHRAQIPRLSQGLRPIRLATMRSFPPPLKPNVVVELNRRTVNATGH